MKCNGIRWRKKEENRNSQSEKKSVRAAKKRKVLSTQRDFSLFYEKRRNEAYFIQRYCCSSLKWRGRGSGRWRYREKRLIACYFWIFFWNLLNTGQCTVSFLFIHSFISFMLFYFYPFKSLFGIVCCCSSCMRHVSCVHSFSLAYKYFAA